MKDDLGDRFKAHEAEYRVTLPHDSFYVIRVDGRAFHTLTRGLDKPFDANFITAMDATAKALCEEIDGAICAYVQSDEISVVIAPSRNHSQPWFGGVLQKIVSVSASIATTAFNDNFVRPDRAYAKRAPARFDSRVLVLPDVSAVADYIWWRQNDAQRNAVSMLAHEYIGKSAVKGMTTKARVEALSEAGVQTGEVSPRFMNGGIVIPEVVHVTKWIPRRDGESGTQLVEFDRSEWTLKVITRARNWFYETFAEVYPPPDPVG